MQKLTLLYIEWRHLSSVYRKSFNLYSIRIWNKRKDGYEKKSSCKTMITYKSTFNIINFKDTENSCPQDKYWNYKKWTCKCNVFAYILNKQWTNRTWLTAICFPKRPSRLDITWIATIFKAGTEHTGSKTWNYEISELRNKNWNSKPIKTTLKYRRSYRGWSRHKFLKNEFLMWCITCNLHVGYGYIW